MAQIVSKIDITLKIPPRFKNLTGKEALVIQLKEGIPATVSDAIADYYIRSRPNIYRYADISENTTEEIQTEEVEEVKVFDALEFLEENAENIEDAVNSLTDRKEVFAICKLMRLTGYTNQTTEKAKQRIIADIKIQKQKQETLGR